VVQHKENVFDQKQIYVGSLVKINHWRFKPESIGIIADIKLATGYEISGALARKKWSTIDENYNLERFVYIIYYNSVLYNFYINELILLG
jgi:hypothetical protein